VKVPARFRVGVATHTGLVRGQNEDDYLLVAPPAGGSVALLAAIADGMGGVAGGAEASRAGLRGLAAGLLGAGGEAARTAVARGFQAASARVDEQARLVPALRDMGTTLTALAFDRGQVVLGHIGDTRAYLLRQGELQQLTTDHALREQGNRLLRCIGGGQPAEAPDLAVLDLVPGDRFLLCTDGVWGTVPAPKLAEAMRLPPAAAADRLVAAANAAGGPDNGTAIVVHVVDAAADAADVEVALPDQEAPRAVEPSPRGRLGAPRWPWLLVALAVVLLAAVVARWTTGFDAFLWLRSLV
jgi:protein phosphatase